MALFYSGPWTIVQLSEVPTLFKIEPHESWADGQGIPAKWASWDRLRRYHVDKESPTSLDTEQRAALREANDLNEPLENTPILENESSDDEDDRHGNEPEELEQAPLAQQQQRPSPSRSQPPQEENGPRPKRARLPNVGLQGYAQEEEMDRMINVAASNIAENS